jgi:hypothetical protein
MLGNRDPQLTVLRWADLADITLRIEVGSDGDHVESCELRDRNGQAMTIPGRVVGGTRCGSRLAWHRQCVVRPCRVLAHEPALRGMIATRLTLGGGPA